MEPRSVVQHLFNLINASYEQISNSKTNTNIFHEYLESQGITEDQGLQEIWDMFLRYQREVDITLSYFEDNPIQGSKIAESTPLQDSMWLSIFVFISIFRPLNQISKQEHRTFFDYKLWVLKPGSPATSKDGLRIRGCKAMLRILDTLIAFGLDDKSLAQEEDYVQADMVHLRETWLTFFDPFYLENQLLPFICELKDLLIPLRDTMKHIVYPQVESKPKQKIVETIPEPFNLTKPKLRKIPIPVPLPKLPPAKPAPQYKPGEPTKEFKELERIKEQTREAWKRLLDSTPQSGLLERTKQWSERKKREPIIEDDFEEKPKIYRNKNWRKALQPDNIPDIKLNTVTLMREEQAVLKRLEMERERMLEPETTAEDEAEELKRMKTRLIVQLSHEEAARAKQEAAAIKKKIATRTKQQVERLARIKEQNEIQALCEAKEKVKQLQAQRSNMEEYHQNIRETKRQEKETLKAQIRAEIERMRNEEAKRLQEVQNRIRDQKVSQLAQDGQPRKLRDDTPVSKGLLDELTLEELSEQLQMMKIHRQQEEIERRNRIVEERRSKLDALRQKKALLDAYKIDLREQRQSKRGSDAFSTACSSVGSVSGLSIISTQSKKLRKEAEEILELQKRLYKLKTSSYPSA